MPDALIRQINSALEADLPPAEVWLAITTAISTALHTDRCSIFFADDRSGEYILAASSGKAAPQARSVSVAFGAGIIGWVGERAELINLEDATLNQHYLPAETETEIVFKSFLGAPIINEGNLLGIVVLERLASGHFAEAAEATLVTTCAQLAAQSARVTQFVNAAEPTQTKKSKRKREPKLYDGIIGAPGVAVGKATVIYPLADFDKIPDRKIKDTDAELEAFKQAIAAARKELRDLTEHTKLNLTVTEQALFTAYARMLDSRSLMNDVKAEILAGQWAPGALKHAIKRRILEFEGLDNEYLRERASDLRAIGLRILTQLQASERESVKLPNRAIILSHELTATVLLELPREKIIGLVSASGSGNSHIAILARSLGIPTIMGLSSANFSELDGHELVIDGYSGQLICDPTASLKREYKMLATEEDEFETELEQIQNLPAETKDKKTVKLLVNTGLAIDASLSLQSGAEGVGLYRTEIPFMIRDKFPSEEEQRIIYRQLLETMAPREVIMRTLDVGGDKALPYFPVEEPNPFLGWRGIRISLDHPELFLAQLRAMLRAAEGIENLAIMLPMIGSITELETAIAYIQQAYDELIAEQLKLKFPKIGVMIEVPSAVYQAYELAKRVDFVSVGSNDLTQYLLAVDRNNARVASRYEILHPAVLRALQQIVKSSRKARRPVGICGELAADPSAAILLLAMGFDSFSMNLRSLPRIKWVIRNFSLARAEELLAEVLQFDDAREVSLHMEMALEEAGLGGLIRAGRQ